MSKTFSQAFPPAKTLALDEQVQDFMDARKGLRLYDALYAGTTDKLLPRKLAGFERAKRA
jgi:hypothetical protein